MSRYFTFQNLAILTFLGGLLIAYIANRSIAKSLKLILYFAPISILFIGKTGSSVIAILVIILSFGVVFNSNGNFQHPSFMVLFWFAITVILLLSSVSSTVPQQIWFLTSWASGVLASYVITTDSNFQDFDVLTYVSNTALVISCTSLLFLLPPLSVISTNLGFSYVNEWGFQRFRGTTGDYELTAEILVLGFIATSAITYKSLSFHILKLSSIAIVLVLTGTRAALLAPVGVALYLFVKKQKSGLLRSSLVLLVPMGLAIFFLGSTLISRYQTQTSSGLTNKLNRSSVWTLYDNLAITPEMLGHGPNYPFLTYGFYPHSLVRSLLYIGGWLALAVFVLGLTYLYAVLLRNIKREESNFTAMKIILLTVFLIDQFKVEFTRTGGYVLFISIFLTLLSQNHSQMSMKNGARLRR